MANTRGESRGKRSAKGQAAAVAASRDGRVGGGGRSKSPPPPSSRGGARSRTAMVLPVGNNDGRQRRATSGNTSGSDSSSKTGRISRTGSDKSSNGSSRRSAKREVVKSTREAGDESFSHAQTHQAEVLSNKEAAAVGQDIERSDEQERSASPLEGAPPEEMEVVDAAVDPVLVSDGQQDDTDSNSEEVAMKSGAGPDDDAAEASPATETNQQREASGVEAWRVDGGLPTSTAGLTEAKAPLAPLPLPEDMSRTTQCQDEDGIDSDAWSSSTTQGIIGQTQPQQRQNQANQLSDSAPVALETIRMSPGPIVTEAPGQDREVMQEKYTMSPLSTKTSPARDGDEADILDDIEEGDDGQDGRLGSETEETQHSVSSAVIDFVPTDRSLAAYCQVCRD